MNARIPIAIAEETERRKAARSRARPRRPLTPPSRHNGSTQAAGAGGEGVDAPEADAPDDVSMIWQIALSQAPGPWGSGDAAELVGSDEVRWRLGPMLHPRSAFA
jgi:hypothetical protein